MLHELEETKLSVERDCAPSAKRVKTELTPQVKEEAVEDDMEKQVITVSCCRPYVFDKYAIVTFRQEADWMQLECSLDCECPRKVPKKVSEDLQTNESVKNEAEVSEGNECADSRVGCETDKSQSNVTSPSSVKLATSDCLKSSLSANNLAQVSNAAAAAAVTTTKSVSFNLPPDHVEDRNSLGNSKYKSTSKKLGGISDAPGQIPIGEPNAQLGFSNYSMTPQQQRASSSLPHIQTPLGFPPYPDPANFGAPTLPVGSNFMNAPPPGLAANIGNAPLYQGFQAPLHTAGPPQMHHVVPPNYPSAGSYLGVHPSASSNSNPTVSEQCSTYPSPVHAYDDCVAVSTTPTSIYAKGPEFHQHLHSHLHQHMHYPASTAASASSQNPGMPGVTPLSSPSSGVNGTTKLLTMAVQPKGKWCGAHAKIAFFIHMKKREKICASVSSAFQSLQPSKNSSFSLVSAGCSKTMTDAESDSSSHIPTAGDNRVCASVVSGNHLSIASIPAESTAS